MQNQPYNIIWIDIETNLAGKVLDIGAIKADGKSYHSSNLNDFALFLYGGIYCCGHNIIEHDAKYLRQQLDSSGIQYYIDTLYWSPLLFARYPYHKLLKDDKFDPVQDNNPLNDAIKARDLFYDECNAWHKLKPTLQLIYYNLLQASPYFGGWFDYHTYYPQRDNIHIDIAKYLNAKVCTRCNIQSLVQQHPIELAYAIAQIDVMSVDNNSITPTWVLKRYPRVENILYQLRGNYCGECQYCNYYLDVIKGLDKWYGYKQFRTYDGDNLQEQAAKLAIANQSLLAVFPTGGGKSITFQLPALMQGESYKGLTVVISPLQSLQKDQVDNLENKHNITKAVRIDGSLDPIERTKQIERVENGQASILYISPESLRSNSICRMLHNRNIVRIVIDEAHCFSSWGHDFRVDYLYIAQFITDLQRAKEAERAIPISCFTATAKEEVVKDIKNYFKTNLGLHLEQVISKASRTNLQYQAIHVQDDKEKDAKLRDLLTTYRCPSIVYVSRTTRATQLAAKLNEDGLHAIAYHGKMDKRVRVANQDKFVSGQCNIIVATKAFGMGVDKDNVGLVVHYDISTSLEDYVQEAGRAGRDERLQAKCYALFNDDDINKHFVFLNQTKITAKEINDIWRAIKKCTANEQKSKLTLSALDIAREAGWSDVNEGEIGTRVSACINALEQSGLVSRGQNMPKVYATALQTSSISDARKRIQDSNAWTNDREREDAVRIVQRLFKTRAKGGRDKDTNDNNEQVDYIADREQIEVERIIRIIDKLKSIKILDDYKDLYGTLDKDKGKTVIRRLRVYKGVEEFFCRWLQDNENKLDFVSPNTEVQVALDIDDNIESEDEIVDKQETSLIGYRFNIKEIRTAMQQQVPNASIDHLKKLINYYDIKRIIKKKYTTNKDYISFRCYLKLDKIIANANKRLDVAEFVLEWLYDTKFNKPKDNEDCKIEFSVLEIVQEYILSNQLLGKVVDSIEVEDALYYLKRIGCLDIDGGFLVIYNRMTVTRLNYTKSLRYTNVDYAGMERYYNTKKEQIHIIAEYLRLLSQDYNKALKLAYDYFVMNDGMFKAKYFGGRLSELRRNMTPTKYNQLFKHLSPIQGQIIDDKKSEYIGIIAGPGSGKTMVLSHKLAAIYYQEDIKHENILMLTFSRAAATEFKIRLIRLIGNAANFVKIKTFHSYCFDLLGLLGSLDGSDEIVDETVAKIKEGSIDKSKMSLAIIVIDEAQDMSKSEFELICTLAKYNPGVRVMAVGDDDQNIYEWRGSSSEYLKRIAHAKGNGRKYELLDNYRSVSNIVEFSNSFGDRYLKDRLKSNPLKAVSSKVGKIAITTLHPQSHIEIPIVNAILRDKPHGSTCIVVRTNLHVNNIVALLSKHGLQARAIQSNRGFRLYDLIELRELVVTVCQGDYPMIDADVWNNAKLDISKRYRQSHNLPCVLRLIRDFEAIHSRYKYKSDLRQFVDESKLQDFVSSEESILVSTTYMTKGREFDNVYLGYQINNNLTQNDTRELYVALTRAKSNLCIISTSTIFGGVVANGVVRLTDNTNYIMPDELVVELEHKDVFLGGFGHREVQQEIARLVSGDRLSISPQGLVSNNTLVVKYSNAFALKLQQYSVKGYTPKEATINHIVYWHDKEDKTKSEMLIILPKLKLILNK
ncbi:MAG: RecQ family ATP-dependent DNA helicase [Clostridiales bacterium]|jgi:ATP-dependent DNA helicase RecQ|nr:RecQ family ATP-dependent DNA helicase [Clostridiales bacterium]